MDGHIIPSRIGAVTWTGEEFPVHIQRAHGRYVFKLFHHRHNHRQERQYGITRGIYLRDLPLNIHELAAMGHTGSVQAYMDECKRTGEKPQL